jgi:serine phosphatase RsbU (regulator of sigma subunit)
MPLIGTAQTRWVTKPIGEVARRPPRVYSARTVRSGPPSYVRVIWTVLMAAAIFGLWLAVTNSAHGGIAFFYAVPIAFTTWWFGWRAGVVATLLCLGLYGIGALIQPVDEFLFTLLVRVVAFALVVVLVEAVRKRVLALEDSNVDLEAIRSALTPAALPEASGLDVAAAFVPSMHGVSGDFYLIAHPPDGSTVAIVGDVVGHGPVVARLATFVRTQLATFAANTGDPAEILDLANLALIEQAGEGSELVSAVCMHFDKAGTSMTGAIAGHPPPLRLPTLTQVEPTGRTSLLGVQRSLSVSTVELGLGPDTGVLAFTDGATDLRLGGDLLGLDGLTRTLAPFAHLPADRFAADAKGRLLAIGDQPLPDDLCLLVLRAT